MGAHAFPDEPEHCVVYRGIREAPLPEIVGMAERWNMPLVRHTMKLDPSMPFGGVDHFILTYHIGGSRVRRVDRSDLRNVADMGAISLQVPFSSGRFACIGRGSGVTYAHLYFRQSMVDEVAESYALRLVTSPGDFFGMTSIGCEGDIGDYIRRGFAKEPASPLEMDSRAYLIVLGLVRYWANGASFSETPGTLRAERLKRVIDLIEEGLGSELRLSDLAKAAGLSPFHFARQFKASTGETPAAYVMRRRVDRAEDLLRHTRLSISQIAYRLGFAHQSHLNRAFKARFGITPGKARRGDLD